MDNPAIHEKRLERARIQHRDGDDFLLDIAVDEMVERVASVTRSFDRAIALFGRTPRLVERLLETSKVKDATRVEEKTHLGSADLIATADRLGLSPTSADLITAPLALHWARDLPGTLIQIANALRPDGLLLACLPGPETLRELRASLLQAESEITGGAALRVDPFTDVRDAGMLLQRCGFALPVVDTDTVTVRYDSLTGLVADLRRFGATSRQRSPALSRETLWRAEQIYQDQFADDDGRIRASFQFISMSGWKPHKSQQKPLQPGSAKTRLAEALKTDEIKLKE